MSWRKRLLLIVSCTIFVVHALHYAYFFVDDEGIPFVFARNLLRGRGLVYNSFEGRVEGYSNFLQVLVSTVWLQLAAITGLGRLAPFFMGKAVSLAAGVGTVMLAGSFLGRRPEIRRPGLAAGLAFLVFFPPLAVWSCSSLEMASVTLLVTIATIALVEEAPAWDRALAAASCLLVLMRIDGFVFVAALLAPAWLAAGPERRRTLGRLAVPILATLTVYHAWRVWYFGDWLSCPLIAKVLYKLHPVHDIVTRHSRRSYGRAFVDLYGLLPAGIGLALLAVASARRAAARPFLASAALLAAYAAVVGDWMLGFRFFLPLAPVLALLVAWAVSSIGRTPIGWMIAAACAAWFGVAAANSATAYDALEHHESWWRHPSLDADRYFGPYRRLYADVARIIPPGTVTAYNQAGFLPYMLDAENLDDLGICSRFVARLPSDDVVFTEVGRYSPLTDGSALRAAQAYVLYRAPMFVIEPLDNLRSANDGVVPRSVLRGHYVLQFTAPAGDAAVYRRAPESLREFQSGPRAFLENLAAPARLVRGYDGEVIPRGRYLQRLPFLAGGVLNRRVTGHAAYDVIFAATDQPVYELHVRRVWATARGLMVLTLRNAAGIVVARDERILDDRRAQVVERNWPEGIRACQLSIELESGASGSTRIVLSDVRAQGQSDALARYVARLPFPPEPSRPAAGQ